MKKGKPFSAWANLVDLGFAMALGNLKKRLKSEDSALAELKASLLRKSDEHLQGLCRIGRRIK